MFTSINGRTAIVTGASRGIGKGIARVFARAGAKVMVVARTESGAKDTLEEIRAAGGTAEMALCDVTDWEAVQAMTEKTAKLFGSVDILCANAGIFPRAKIADMEPDEWDHVMAANLKSNFLCTKACIPHFECAGKGRVILTSSITGPINGFPGWSHYAASKAGQLGFLRSAAMEFARYNTTVNAILPGNILTESYQKYDQQYLDNMAAEIPLKHMGAVEDIANAALFFATDEAGYITGQTLVVDGGQTLPESMDSLAEI